MKSFLQFPHFIREPSLDAYDETTKNRLVLKTQAQLDWLKLLFPDLLTFILHFAPVSLKDFITDICHQGKSMALPYARAVHEMVPVTPLAGQNERQQFHEPINDLPAHPLTGAQIFYPVPESRSFTRVDAGRVFSGAPAMENDVAAKIEHPSNLAEEVNQNPQSIEWVGKGANARQVLQPADVRIPHPQLVQLEIDRKLFPNERRAVAQRHTQRLERQEAAEKKRRDRAQAHRENSIKHVEPEGGRFDYRIQDAVYTRETTGADGRAAWAPGRRYGVPTNDRKRGMVKIPTRVEA